MVYIEVIPLYIIRNVCMFTSSYHWKGIITNDFFVHQKLKASNANIFTCNFLHLDVLASNLMASTTYPFWKASSSTECCLELVPVDLLENNVNNII